MAHVVSTVPNQYRFHCGTVYLICWITGHYIGFTTDLLLRWEQHRLGQGSNATKKAVSEGNSLELVEIYTHTTTDFEKFLQKSYRCIRCGYTGSMTGHGNEIRK